MSSLPRGEILCAWVWRGGLEAAVRAGPNSNLITLLELTGEMTRARYGREPFGLHAPVNWRYGVVGTFETARGRFAHGEA